MVIHLPDWWTHYLCTAVLIIMVAWPRALRGMFLRPTPSKSPNICRCWSSTQGGTRAGFCGLGNRENRLHAWYGDTYTFVNTRRVEEESNVSHVAILTVLHEQLLYSLPFETSAGSSSCWFYSARELLCQCFVQRSAEHFFASSMLFTNAAHFGRHIINIHNQHQWERRILMV
jgi:hypothetical protein